MIGVFGSGSWATAVAKIVLEHPNTTINWWIREPDIIEGIKETGHNPTYLSEIYFDTNQINFSNDISEIIKKSDDLLFVVPSAFLDDSLQNITPEMLEGKNIHSAIKGVVLQTNQIVADYFHDKFNIDYNRISIISGPSHAEETAQQKLTYLTVASQNSQLADYVAEFIQCRYVKTVVSDDIHGIEYAAVLKNIYALAAGICKGLGYGDNLFAVLISNAMQEMDIFINELHPMDYRQLERFPYLGDLLVTAYSQHSRNRTFGAMIGFGYSVKGAQLEMKMIAEGYYATKCIEKIREKLGISMPIVEATYKILYEGLSARRVMGELLKNLK
ncbi:MAG: NAD(P)H-dependent glycerol-3-phosphate dehydrogenase [Bacteroidales bacterium]|nr:NAD(P)H-dependent glycerol-3-phosphate dehydrogenase [Bacteroidales bacterium]